MAHNEYARSGFLEWDDLIPDARLRAGEPDAFRHLPIAARVAELAVHANTPINIALFGPWGSGKSSFFELLRNELAHRDSGIALVRYDAWKYGGGALKRNFISSAATELGMRSGQTDSQRFHRGLYENRRTVRFDPLQLFRSGEWKSWGTVLFFAALLATVAVLGLAGWTAVFTDRDVTDEVSRLAPGIGTRIGAFVFAIGAALKVLDGAKVEVEQVVPSADEQFAELFRELVNEATKRPVIGRATHRLVFFIDELDRCSKQDVVSTLTSLRTFLDQEHCVFVVAADREVLEEALEEVPQATPVREEEPYYSSASAFLDKIFQHQFTLPPLRGGRLTGFARELVQGRGGLWKDLRQAGALDGVLYTLIPSHVRAPRRVKVLLNNFATNARVSEARGINWLARAEEIAKLTVLQTEFPRLASDLYHDPRLLSMLLTPPEEPTPRQQVLLSRHRITKRTDSKSNSAADTDTDEAYEAPDLLLTDEESRGLLSRQREDLHRYLQSRTAPDPGRDLLYLEAVGDWVGFDDPEINRLIEDEAPTRPNLVTEALHDHDADDKLAVARVLGHLSEREFGQERRNIITAMTGILATITVDQLDNLGHLVANVASYRAEQDLAAEQLPGALVLAVAAGDDGRELASAVLGSDTLLETADSRALVARLLPRLSDDDARTVEESIARCYGAEPDVLLDVIADHPASTVARLFETASEVLVEVLRPTAPPVPTPAPPTAAVQRAVRPGRAPVSDATTSDTAATGLDAEQVETLTTQLIDALDNRGSELLETKASLVGALLAGAEEATYSPCRQRGPDLALQVDDPDLRNDILLDGFLAGPGEDWRHWSVHLVDQPKGRKDTRCENAIMAVLGTFPTQSSDVQRAAAAAMQDLLRADAAVNPHDADTTTAILPTTTVNLNSVAWWESDASTLSQAAIYEVTGVLADHFDGELAEALYTQLATDIARADPTIVTWNPDIARRFADLAIASPPVTLAEAERVASTAVGNAALLARLRIAERSKALGASTPHVPLAEIIDAAHAGNLTEADTVIAAWLKLDPPVSEVGEVVRAVGRIGARTAKSLQTRVESMKTGDATDLFLELVDAMAHQAALNVLGPHVDAAKTLTALSDRLAAAGGSKRDSLIKAVSAVSMTSQSERQIVGRMALDLLTDKPNHAKSEAAASLVQLIHEHRYGLKTHVQEAVVAADKESKLGDKARRRFVDLGLLRRKRRSVLGIKFG